MQSTQALAHSGVSLKKSFVTENPRTREQFIGSCPRPEVCVLVRCGDVGPCCSPPSKPEATTKHINQKFPSQVLWRKQSGCRASSFQPLPVAKVRR